jgi:hypothetical protein
MVSLSKHEVGHERSVAHHPPAVTPAKAGVHLSSAAGSAVDPCLRRDDTCEGLELCAYTAGPPYTNRTPTPKGKDT